jgi:phage/conjugal plasmid C-4 type zinc finger TraR family protein
MADIIDTAAEIEELQRNAALSAHRIDRNAVSAERCEECDEPIPEPRRAAVPGCKTCAVPGVIELRNKQRGIQ